MNEQETTKNLLKKLLVLMTISCCDTLNFRNSYERFYHNLIYYHFRIVSLCISFVTDSSSEITPRAAAALFNGTSANQTNCRNRR